MVIICTTCLIFKSLHFNHSFYDSRSKDLSFTWTVFTVGIYSDDIMLCFFEVESRLLSTIQVTFLVQKFTEKLISLSLQVSSFLWT